MVASNSPNDKHITSETVKTILIVFVVLVILSIIGCGLLARHRYRQRWRQRREQDQQQPTSTTAPVVDLSHMQEYFLRLYGIDPTRQNATSIINSDAFQQHSHQTYSDSRREDPPSPYSQPPSTQPTSPSFPQPFSPLVSPAMYSTTLAENPSAPTPAPAFPTPMLATYHPSTNPYAPYADTGRFEELSPDPSPPPPLPPQDERRLEDMTPRFEETSRGVELSVNMPPPAYTP